jgi:hypothetical protein
VRTVSSSSILYPPTAVSSAPLCSGKRRASALLPSCTVVLIDYRFHNRIAAVLNASQRFNQRIHTTLNYK